MVCAYGISRCTRVFSGQNRLQQQQQVTINTIPVLYSTTTNNTPETGVGIVVVSVLTPRFSFRTLAREQEPLQVPSLGLHIVFHCSGSRPPSKFEGIPSRALPFPNSGTTHGGNIDISMCCERISM